MTIERLHMGETGPVSLNMTRAIAQGSPINTLDTLVPYRQQVEESHHDLVNLLTLQIAIVLNPLIDSTN